MGQHEPSIEPPEGKGPLILGILFTVGMVVLVWWTVFR